MGGVERAFVAANKALVAFALAVILAIVFMNVVGRYGFSYSFAWVEEAARHLMVFGAFCGLGLALRQGRLVAIGLVVEMFPARIALMIRWLIVLAMFAFMAAICWLGIRFVEFGWDKETMSTGMARGIPYLSIPIGATLFLVHLLFFARRFVRGEFEFDDAAPPADPDGA